MHQSHLSRCAVLFSMFCNDIFIRMCCLIKQVIQSVLQSLNLSHLVRRRSTIVIKIKIRKKCLKLSKHQTILGRLFVFLGVVVGGGGGGGGIVDKVTKQD